MTRESKFLLSALALLILVTKPAFSLDVDRLQPADIRLAKDTLKILKPFIDSKKSTGAMNLLTFATLDAPLKPEQKNFLDEIRKLDPKLLGATAHSFAEVPMDTLFMRVPDQSIRRGSVSIPLPKQYLPLDVYKAYEGMMEAMKKDLGKVLYVDSGYRSPAYQLYLFLRYLPRHRYSLRENNRFVALPGHSEHGAPHHQAIDFINEEGVNGEDHPEEFEALPEYTWLTEHANSHGFFLSYPRGNQWGTSFEPWHWHYEGK